MKITSNNSRMFDPNEGLNKDVKNTPKTTEESPKTETKDRVEISGEKSTRNNSTNRISQAYQSNSIAESEKAESQPTVSVSPESSISAVRMEEIQERINSGYYDSDEVLDDVARMMANDVKKIDHNI